MEKKKTTAKEKKATKTAASEKELEQKSIKNEESDISEDNKNFNIENFEFKGEYLKAIGRRKTSVAQVRMYKDGKGIIIINGQKGSQYFSGEGINIATQPLKVTGHLRDMNFSIIVKGGGVSGQVEACRHGIARALLALDPLLKDSLRAHGFLTRDPRQKERKKPGLKGARKRPQWSKR